MTHIDKAEALAFIAKEMKDARQTYSGFGHAQEALRFAEQILVAGFVALPARGVGVKPLVWGDDGNGGFIARGVGRTYNVHRLALDPGTWGAVGVGDTSANADDVKAACDRANTAIVLSALALTDAAQARAAALREAASLVDDLGQKTIATIIFALIAKEAAR